MDSEIRRVFFRSEDGEVVVYPSDQGGQLGDVLMLSFEGELYYEVKMLSIAGDRENHDIRYYHPALGTEGEIRRRGEVVNIGDEVYRKVDQIEGDLDIVALATHRKMLCLGTLPNKDLVYCSVEAYDFAGITLGLFMGPAHWMNRLEVLDVERRIIGGPTYIETTKGTLFLSSLDEGKPTGEWEERGKVVPLKMLKPELYNIIEMGDMVVVVKN